MRISDWSSDVCSSDLKLAGHNRLRLLKLAGNHGERPHVTEIETSYADLLGMVIDAGDDSRVHAPEKKCISRATATGWWRNQIALCAAENRRPINVYHVRYEKLFSDFNRGADLSDMRTVTGGNMELDGVDLRSHEHNSHLQSQIPI